MAIAAHWEESPKPAGKLREPRRKLRLEVSGVLVSGGTANVVVHNVSATGLLIESRISLAIGEKIEIDLPHAGATWGKVIWTSGNLFGCQFDAPIAPAALSAAQLQSAVGREVDLAAQGDSLSDESLGVRLQRLRKRRGLSLSQVAAELGVSKPTVWAWEQGRARPVDGRIEALAEALGVEKSELLPGRAAPGLRDLLARSRAQIADAVGTSPDKVRIMIEL